MSLQNYLEVSSRTENNTYVLYKVQLPKWVTVLSGTERILTFGKQKNTVNKRSFRSKVKTLN